jgi:hypothetical protein
MLTELPRLLTKYYGDQIKVNEIGGGYSANGEMRNAYTILTGNLEGNKQLRNLSVDRINLAQDSGGLL